MLYPDRKPGSLWIIRRATAGNWMGPFAKQAGCETLFFPAAIAPLVLCESFAGCGFRMRSDCPVTLAGADAKPQVTGSAQ